MTKLDLLIADLKAINANPINNRKNRRARQSIARRLLRRLATAKRAAGAEAAKRVQDVNLPS
jgi:hypothetical protein